MNKVKPIEGKRQMMKLKTMMARFHPKYEIMLTIGTDTGLRISDILAIKAGKFARNKKVRVKELKTGKCREVAITSETKALISKYVRLLRLTSTDYLVYSREGKRHIPLSRSQAYRTIARIAREMGLVSIGTHSMRKTFANNFIRAGGTVEGLQNNFRHGNVLSTLCYLLNDNS